jgi:zinc transporter 9
MSVTRGVQQIWTPEPLEHLSWAFWILGGSAFIESISLGLGLRAVRIAAREHGVSLVRYLREGPDTMGVAVVLEDGSAVIGVFIALAALAATTLTGDLYWDGVGSVGVGLLLGISAVFLINRNRRLLLEPSLPPERVREMVQVLEQDPVIRRIRDVKASRLGPSAVRFKAEIEFDGRALAQRLLQQYDLAQTVSGLQSEEDLRRFLLEFGDAFTEALGDEVDRVEEQLSKAAPEAQHVDLEPD